MTEFWFENFALFADGHLVLIDLEDTVLVPKDKEGRHCFINHNVLIHPGII